MTFGARELKLREQSSTRAMDQPADHDVGLVRARRRLKGREGSVGAHR